MTGFVVAIAHTAENAPPQAPFVPHAGKTLPHQVAGGSLGGGILSGHPDMPEF